MSQITYAASVARPDGITVTVTITAPDDRPDVGELAEVAQMGASSTNATLNRHAAFVARTHSAEEPF